MSTRGKSNKGFFAKPELNPYQEDINKRKKAFSVPKTIGSGPGGARRPTPLTVMTSTTTTTTTRAIVTTTTTVNPYITTSKANIIVYGYGTTWSYVIGNDNGGLTSELQFTGIDTSTWSLYNVYPVESKGWGVIFSDGSNYKFVSLKSSGQVIDVTDTDNYNDYDTLEDKGFFYSYSVGADEYYKFFNGLTVSTNVITNSNYNGYGSNYDNTSKNGGFIVTVYSNDDSNYHRYYLKGASASDMGTNGQNQIFTFVNGSFIFKIVDNGTYYTTVYIYDESLNLKQTIDISTELYHWYDLNSYGIDKAMIYFYGPDNASYGYLFTYDGVTDTLLSKQIDNSTGSFDFYYTNSYPGYTYDHFSETLGIYLYHSSNGSGSFNWYDGTASFLFIEGGTSSIGDPVELPPANSWDFETIGSLWTLPTGTGSSYASPNYHDLESVNLSLISHNGVIYGATISGFTAANDVNVSSYGLRNRSVTYYYRDGVIDFYTVDSNGVITISSITSSNIGTNYNGNSFVVRDYDNSTSYYLGSTNSLVNLNTNYGTIYWPEDNMAPNYESPSYLFLFNYNTTYDGVMINNNQASWTASFGYLSGMNYNIYYNPYFMATSYVDAGTLYLRKYNTSNGVLTDTITLNNVSWYSMDMIYKMAVVEIQHSGGTYTYYYLTQNTSKSVGLESSDSFSFNDWSWWW